jgi:4-amino-4-deoxy-L-arabinose transferase-like glycosyltransferase
LKIALNSWKEIFFLGKKWQLPAWLFHWEIHIIVLIAGFLRFYKVDTASDFDMDQALMYRAAYDAIHHGLWPVTNSTASIGFANAPGLIYLFMIPAAFTSDPLAGIWLSSLFSTAAVAVTYIFVSRYYSRIAAIIAALLYAAAFTPLWFSRFLWQPNMMHLFVIVFIWVLFRGVVDRRKGWLGPSLILLGMLYQTHGITLLLSVPLAIALICAPETLRWRDLFYGLAGLIIIFFPFFLWHWATNFSDLTLFLSSTKEPARLDWAAIDNYKAILNPYRKDVIPSHPLSFVRTIYSYIAPSYRSLLYLVTGSLVLISGVIIFQMIKKWRSKGDVISRKDWQTIWLRIMPAPESAGLFILCVWSFIPIAFYLRHSINLIPHYFLMVFPGPFILIGYSVVKLSSWLDFKRVWAVIVQGILYLSVGLVILGQMAGSIAIIRDYTHGYYQGTFDADIYPDHADYINDLYSLKLVLATAEHLAEQRHVKRIIVASDSWTEVAFNYLGEHTQHETTVVSSYRGCLLLPTDGSAIFIMPPYSAFYKLVSLYGATFLQNSPRLGGDPFKIYEISSVAQTASGATMGQDLRADVNVTIQQQIAEGQKLPWLISQWTVLHDRKPFFNTTYTYHFTGVPQGKQEPKMESICTANSIHKNDQLITIMAGSDNMTLPQTLSIGIEVFTSLPETPWVGPFHLGTHRHVISDQHQLQTVDNKSSITLPVKH